MILCCEMKYHVERASASERHTQNKSVDFEMKNLKIYEIWMKLKKFQCIHYWESKSWFVRGAKAILVWFEAHERIELNFFEFMN